MDDLDRIYSACKRHIVITSNELSHLANEISGQNMSYQTITNKYISRMIRKRMLLRVKRGLYYVVDEKSNEEALRVSEKLSGVQQYRSAPWFLIGSKIRDQGFIGYGSALEYYLLIDNDNPQESSPHYVPPGSKNAHERVPLPINENEYPEKVYITIPARKRFDPVKYGGITYQPVFSLFHDVFIDEKRDPLYDNETMVRISNRSRTMIDCLDRPEYCDGIGVLFKKLTLYTPPSPSSLKQVMDTFVKDTIYRKVGYTISWLQKNTQQYNDPQWDILLEHIDKMIGSSPLYFVPKKHSIFKPRWNLYVPVSLEDPDFLRI